MQLGELASLDVVLIVFWFILGPATLALAIWAIVDAAGRPSEAFEAANTAKALWITLVAVFSVICGPVGLVISIVYLASIRRRVRDAQATFPVPVYGAVAPAYGTAGSAQQPQAAPGWYRDPNDPTTEWYWDGTRYVSSRTIQTPPPPPSATSTT